MSTPGLPTIWELIAEGAATLPEPFSRAALINWVSARRPDVGVSSIATHIQLATDNAGSPPSGRTPLLHRVDRGRYVRHRGTDVGDVAVDVPCGRLVLIGSSGATTAEPMPVARLFSSPGFVRARDAAVRARLPWFVLSAKHGLLDAGDVVGPYDVQIGDQSAGYRTAWGEWVVAQLAERVRLDGVTVEVHGGVDFAQPLRQPLARRGAALELPLPGAWQESGDHDDGGPGDGAAGRAPVRVALGRLRDLVTGHRAS
ncbi:hypothetical protein FHU33_1575 [Blastococcus colisei]|uniref:Uncharacterized protein n=1 Tax=Blastococcus colisei TaxID=1564162 RepID=A0A543PDM6_9ACTN|nr:DUF6884 domain-containing protein [Blastococcus colisei]TQN42181.1 hypothetical protein FHU33_1575 [Blastococcus colisei]